jgi:hypothetical protein
LYGKDFDVRNLGDGSTHDDALTASLVAYWHQLHGYRDGKTRGAVESLGLEIEKPLWVLLGLTVLGRSAKKTEEETEYRSDMVDCIGYMARLLKDGGKSVLENALKRMVANDGNGQLLLPETAWNALRERDHNTALLAETILRDVFHWQPGAVLHARILKRSPGEIGLGVSLGDKPRYFGVVNVGDAESLGDALASAGITLEPDAFTPSLFRELERKESDVHVLIGSRRFAEGWNNYRASTLTLLRLGSGEGPLIIQMFGRVVRFWGEKRSGKRLESPPPEIRPLQTAYVFGLRADYMQKFLATLHENGVQEKVTWFDTEPMDDKTLARLAHVIASEPEKRDFSVDLSNDSGWHRRIGKVTLSLGMKIQSTQMKEGQTQTVANVVGQDITERFKDQASYLNYDAIHFRMLVIDLSENLPTSSRNKRHFLR